MQSCRKMRNGGIKIPATTTLPAWFWALYYAFLIITFGISIFAIMRKRNRVLSIVNLVMVITVPAISFINSIGRSEPNEFQHLIIHLMQGSLWAIYAFVGYLFILVWWILIYIRIIILKHKN
jgi:hypothetical protein